MGTGHRLSGTFWTSWQLGHKYIHSVPTSLRISLGSLPPGTANSGKEICYLVRVVVVALLSRPAISCKCRVICDLTETKNTASGMACSFVWKSNGRTPFLSSSRKGQEKMPWGATKNGDNAQKIDYRSLVPRADLGEFYLGRVHYLYLLRVQSRRRWEKYMYVGLCLMTRGVNRRKSFQKELSLEVPPTSPTTTTIGVVVKALGRNPRREREREEANNGGVFPPHHI